MQSLYACLCLASTRGIRLPLPLQQGLGMGIQARDACALAENQAEHSNLIVKVQQMQLTVHCLLLLGVGTKGYECSGTVTAFSPHLQQDLQANPCCLGRCLQVQCSGWAACAPL